MRTVAAVLALVLCVHAGLWAILRTEAHAPDFKGQLASVSYAPPPSLPNPYADEDQATANQIRADLTAAGANCPVSAAAGSTGEDLKATSQNTAERQAAEDQAAARIRADLKAIAAHARAIRTYSSTGVARLIPPIANEFGLKVTVGAWLGKNVTCEDQVSNQREIRAAIDLARRNSNVNAVVVGNETIYRGDLTIDQLIGFIKEAKQSSPVPVTTGEIGSVWLEHPELASSVDFVAAHVLPYWNGIEASHAVDHAINFYDMLRRALPGKRIVIAEFGWPSAGYNFQAANPGRIEQATVLRDFARRAQAYGIDYNIVEAIDQPWKTAEGGVGPYWGIFDASPSLQAKFPWAGPIGDPDYIKRASLAVLIGLLLSLPILAMAGATPTQALTLAISANLAGAWFAAVFDFWKGHYFVPGAAFALGLGVLLLVPLVAIALARVEEIAAIAFGRPPRRLASAPPLVPEVYAPKVSIHIPAYREPPEMLKATLDSIAKLDYPNLECVLVINNTPDPALWRPVEDHCNTLGERFKFIRIENLAGYKAGALRLALANTAADAEIIGVIDADYVVESNWLKDLVPLFADQRVGLVQSPQDHRDGSRSLMHRAMNSEYAGFFDIGMVQRNEFNAIIVHGTMCLIRRAAIETAGSWSSDTIVEDADLGLTLLEQGWLTHYTNRRYGYGLLPDTFDQYKRQRHRWAFGGLQIVRKHWRRFLPGTAGLSREQKREYSVGWLNWLGAESIGVVVALLNIVWVPFIAFADIAVPDRILTVPILASFAVSVAHFVALYRLRVRATAGEMVGAVFAGMSVQWTVARAVSMGLVKEHLPFLRTAKGGATEKGPDFPAFWEAVISGLLLSGAATLVVMNAKQVREIYIFAIVLVVQSLPFLSAVALACIEGTRFNSLAYWRGKAADLLPQPAAVMAEVSKVPTDNRVEVAQ
jgi:cellulose synthase/poly-beta-1,6-N-acetylglucosamine synthase-like glycosyltransferase/exo-beta-1,3-glucanase (GH17 family)